MPSFCTCGVQLPPDARFCHKCGKPQYEMLPQDQIEEMPAAVAAVLTAAALSPVLEINFHNPIAVRTALLTAMIGFVLGTLPIPGQILWMFISLLLAGFLAVLIYVRKTGQKLSLTSGARMGWITGLFSFTLATVFFTLSMLLISDRGGVVTVFRDMMKERGAPQADLESLVRIIQTPGGFAQFLFLALAVLFVMFTIFPILGGVLGAKVMARDRA